jgi:dUTP pyrophosphatase
VDKANLNITLYNKMSLIVSKLSANGIIPKRGSNHAAGLDLYSPISATIQPLQRLLVPLDIAIELQEGTFGHILPRSGLALKNGIHIGAGVIDEDYRGNVGVLLFNLSDQPFMFNKGDRIAQLVVKCYEKVDVVEKNNEELSSTLRGNGGFGSSGL